MTETTRNAEIRARRQRGFTTTQLSREYGVTRQRIAQICTKPEPSPRLHATTKHHKTRVGTREWLEREIASTEHYIALLRKGLPLWRATGIWSGQRVGPEFIAREEGRLAEAEAELAVLRSQLDAPARHGELQTCPACGQPVLTGVSYA